MKCPICGKELELKNKQIGTNENGDPIFNEYAICRDCRKQWNLDKQRAKKAAEKSTPKKVDLPKKEESAKKEQPLKREEAVKKAEAPKKEPVKKAEAPKKEPVKNTELPKKAPVKKPDTENVERRKRRASESSEQAAPAKKPVKKRPVQKSSAESAEEKRYSNIPPERVRTKHEKAVRKGYEDMLATGAIGKPQKKKRADEDTRTIEKPSTSKSAAERRRAAVKPAPQKPEPQIDEYDDDDYYEDAPRFRVMRVLLAIISLAGFGYFMYKGFSTGLSSSGDGAVSGLTFVILALCLLVSALLYFITLGTNSIFAFLLPIIFYIGGGVFAFLKKGDELQLLIAAGACAVLAVISLILLITSRGGDDYEDDYDDAFEDDYADDYDD